MAYFIIVFLIVLLLISWFNKSDNKQSYIDLWFISKGDG